MKIKFLGAAHEVTGSCTLLSVGGYSILIDCGMEQGADTYENCELPVSPSDIDCVFLTHAHIDHSGKLPQLVANGYSGPIYSTGATFNLCDIMLMDSAHIQQQEALWRNKKAKRAGGDEYTPLYTTEDVEKTMSLFMSCEYKIQYDVFDCLKVRFIDAGHLLGSASIELTVTENGKTKIILFSGDIGNVSRPLINDPVKPEKADIVIIESTYGDRLHSERKDYRKQLSDVISKTLSKGGNVIIPSFAVGRTQELLYLIREIKEQNLVRSVPDFPVWIDSPLAIEATKIYSGSLPEYYDEDTLKLIKSGVNVLNFSSLHIATTTDESMRLNSDTTPKVIISASGMCEAGRIRHHLKHNLWRPDCTVLFVGYQANGTLGRALVSGTEKVKLFGEEIRVAATIEQMDGISGHADKNMLLGWLENINKKPEIVFVNHGADEVCELFAGEIEEKIGCKAVAPYNSSEYDLVSGECLEKGNTHRIVKKDVRQTRTSAVFEKLLAAGRKLMSVIEHNRGGSNKDIAKFTSQINDLCSKWDR